MLVVSFYLCYAESHDVECLYAECHSARCHGAFSFAPEVSLDTYLGPLGGLTTIRNRTHFRCTAQGAKALSPPLAFFATARRLCKCSLSRVYATAKIALP